MDVRCEKCQTEYELDEARLKPGGVTVKCTNCGHMFKIRKRSNTNVGAPVVEQRPRPASKDPGNLLRDDDPTTQTDTSGERHWLIRLENGEQKSCRELATLQQWIVAGVVTRDSLISRSGKTWKSLGDIAELAQYFTIFDEARATREIMPTKPPAGKPTLQGQSTMLGVSAGPKAASSGGTILDEAELEGRPTGNFKAHRGTTQPPPPPPSTKTPALGSGRPAPTIPTTKPSVTATPPVGVATTQLKAPPAVKPPAPPVRPTPMPVAAAEPARAIPEPPPPAKPAAKPEPTAPPSTWAAMPAKSAAPAGRATGVWATESGVKPTSGDGAGPSGPFAGKIAAIPDEPAFAGKLAGRVRAEPADESSFKTGKVRMLDDDDDDVLPRRRGSRVGLWLALLALLVVGAGAGAVYMVIAKKAKAEQAKLPRDAAAAVAVVTDAAPVEVTPIIDAAPEAPTSPLDGPRKDLGADIESRLREAMKALDGQDDPEAQALRAHLAAQLAQDLLDRAGLLVDKTEADKLRKEAKTIVIDAATLAQKAQKAKPEAAAGNLAMADVLRLQGKRAVDIKRYADGARADTASAATWGRDIALADALVLARDGKLDQAKLGFAAIDDGDGKLETSGDVRARFHLALIAYSQNRPNDAKPLVDAILIAQAEHAGARALATRLETLVAKSDPLPPEDHKDAGVPPGPGSNTASVPPDAGTGSAKKPPEPAVGGSYDAIMKEANKVAESNCARAIELYQKAVDLKPDSAEAHTGMGYCFVDAKQFASAQSKFRTALRFSGRFEPALFGIAEAYHQQGRKDDAIEAYRAYLAVYPGTPKAIRALERLGATVEGGTPTPTPTPTPPPPEAGSGSG